MKSSLGVVMYFGASVVKMAGLQEAGIGEVLLVGATAVMVVQVLRDEFFWLSIGALVIPAGGRSALWPGALAFRTETLDVSKNELFKPFGPKKCSRKEFTLASARF
jgi:hypothetical protein